MTLTINGQNGEEMEASSVVKIGLLFVLVGTAALVGGGLWLYSQLSLSQNGTAVIATIVKKGHKSNSKTGSLCAPTIKFTIQGKTTVYTFRTASTGYCLKEGTTIPVLYTTSGKSGALHVMIPQSTTWGFPLALIFLGSIFAFLGGLTTKAGFKTLRQNKQGMEVEAS